MRRPPVHAHPMPAARRGCAACAARAERARLLAYWRDPDPENRPDQYLRGAEASVSLLALAARHLRRADDVLEPGCGPGRNLWHLWEAGWTRLIGVEVNGASLRLLRETYGARGLRAALHEGPAEEVLPAMAEARAPRSLGVVTMAFLEHVHPSAEARVFGALARMAHTLIVLEDESTRSPRHFPRNYRRAFRRLGMRERESMRRVPGLPPMFRARVLA